MNQLKKYITDSLQSVCTPGEIKSLTTIICREVLEMNAVDIHLCKDIKLSTKKRQLLENAVRRLQNNEPLQYVLGTVLFQGLRLFVAPGVLIPRPETEELVERILKEHSGASNILDIGTGSGCIALSLAKKIPGATVEAWDVSAEALKIARRNNKMIGANVRFRQIDVLSSGNIRGKFDLIVSNPPYVTESEKKEMDKNVLDWEPASALFVPDSDPLLFYRRIATLGLELLLPGGQLFFEINQAYGSEIARLLKDTGYRNVRISKDLFNNDRFATAIR